MVESLTHIPKINRLIPVDARILLDKMAKTLAFELQLLPLASGKVMRKVVVAQWQKIWLTIQRSKV